MRIGYINNLTSAKEVQVLISMFEEVGVLPEHIIINQDFNTVWSALSKGDMIVVRSYADIFTSLPEFLNKAITVAESGIIIKSLTEHNLEVSESQLEFIKELSRVGFLMRKSTTKKGLQKAMESGKKLGRPLGTTKVNPKIREVIKLRNKSNITVAKACEIAGCNPRSYYRYMEKK